MLKFIVGAVFGFILASVGITGMANMADKSVNNAKVVVQEQAKP